MDEPVVFEDPAATRPYYRLLGFKAVAGEPRGQSLVRLVSRPDLENSRGEVHGGVVASLLDAAMGTATRTVLKPGEATTTASLTVNYLQPGRGTLSARATVVRAGGTLVSCEAHICDDRGVLVAHAVGTMRTIRPAASTQSKPR